MFTKLKCNFLAMCAVLALCTTSCVPGLAPAIMKATAVVAQATSILNNVNAVANTFFDLYPDTPAEVRNEYLFHYTQVNTLLTEYQNIADGAKDADDGKLLEAFAKFQGSYDNLLVWLEKYNLRDVDGNLRLQGRLISQVPPASAFRSK